MKLKIIIFNKGLELFHLGFLNTVEGKKYIEYEQGLTEDNFNKLMKNVKKGEMDTSIPDHGKFFSLVPEGPYLYGADDIRLGAMKYKTIRPIVLIDIESKRRMFDDKEYESIIRTFQRWLTDQGTREVDKTIKDFTNDFDGWIGYDDYPGPWREIFLKDPSDIVTKGERYILNKKDIKTVKDYQDDELKRLHDRVMSCFDVEYTGFSTGAGKITKINNVSHCDSLSLKRV